MALRLFVAWPLDDALRREIGRIAGPLRNRLPAASWPRAESIHLTFAFLGDAAPDRVPAIGAALDASAARAPIEVHAGEVGLFPDERRPRVAWIGLEPHAPLNDLASAIRAALTAAGASFDAKPFRPHLTIARIKAPWRTADVANLREAFRGWSPPVACVDRIVLYQSVLGSGGATHTEVHSVALAPAS